LFGWSFFSRKRTKRLKNFVNSRIITSPNLIKLSLSMKTLAHFLIVAFLGFLLSSCGGGDDGVNNKSDSTAPFVISYEPEDLRNKTLPANTQQISIQFSESIKGVEALKSGLSVEPKLPGSWAYNESEYKLVFTFENTAADLPTDTNYVIILKTSIQDIEGNALLEPERIGFSTPQSYRVKGVIKNLDGSLKLVDQSGNMQTVQGMQGNDADNKVNFEFSASLASGEAYKVEITQLADTNGFCASNELSGVVANSNPSIIISCNKIRVSKAEAASWNSYYSTFFIGEKCADTNSVLHCAHGGELRHFTLPESVTSCDELSATDNQGVFHWQCSEDAGVVTVSSTGFVEGKGLTDLIDFQNESWKSMRINIMQNGSGTSLGEPTSGVWWNNPVKLAGSYPVLDAAGTIYIIKESGGSNFLIKADGVALVTAPDVTHVVAYSDGRNAIEILGASYTWIEGKYRNIEGNANGLVIKTLPGSQATNNVVNNFNMTYASEALIWLDEAYGTTIKNARLENSEKFGIRIDKNPALLTSYDGIAEDVFVDNEIFNVITRTHVLDADEAAYVIDGSFNKLIDVVASWNVGDGFRVTGNHNVFSGISSFNNLGHGVSLNSARSNILLNTYTSSNDGAGIAFISDTIAGFTQSDYNFIANLTSVNNFEAGVLIDAGSNSDTNTLNNVVAAYNSTDSTKNCTNNSSSTSCDAVTTLTLADAPITDVFVHDINGSSSERKMLPELIGQGWGEYDDAKGACFSNPELTETCILMDWRLLTTNTSLRDTNLIPSIMAEHTNLIKDQNNLEDNLLVEVAAPYLENSVEIIADNIGNDNGLCENNETCLYTPNLGAYQGDGVLESVDGFAGPVDSNITLLQRVTNGVVIPTP